MHMYTHAYTVVSFAPGSFAWLAVLLLAELLWVASVATLQKQPLTLPPVRLISSLVCIQDQLNLAT